MVGASITKRKMDDNIQLAIELASNFLYTFVAFMCGVVIGVVVGRTEDDI